jgi:hypothetical protein
MCCPDSLLDSCCFCCLKGDFAQSYRIDQDFTSQFSVLPVNKVVIDAMTYRQANTAFKAEAKKEKGPWIDLLCRFQCCCNCCACCIGTIKIEDQVDKFELKETHVIGAQPRAIKEGTKTIDGAEWKIVKEGKDDIVVVLHYRSILGKTICRSSATFTICTTSLIYIWHVSYARMKSIDMLISHVVYIHVAL